MSCGKMSGIRTQHKIICGMMCLPGSTGVSLHHSCVSAEVPVYSATPKIYAHCDVLTKHTNIKFSNDYESVKVPSAKNTKANVD